MGDEVHYEKKIWGLYMAVFPGRQGHNRRSADLLKLTIDYGIIILLLTVSEDRATLGSDLSAGTGVSGRGDAMCITLFLFQALASPASPLYGNPKALNLGVWGKAPALLQQIRWTRRYSFSI